MSGLITKKLVVCQLTVKSCDSKLFLSSKPSESFLAAQVCDAEHEHAALIQKTANFTQGPEQSVNVNVHKHIKWIDYIECLLTHRIGYSHAFCLMHECNSKVL